MKRSAKRPTVGFEARPEVVDVPDATDQDEDGPEGTCGPYIPMVEVFEQNFEGEDGEPTFCKIVLRKYKGVSVFSTEPFFLDEHLEYAQEDDHLDSEGQVQRSLAVKCHFDGESWTATEAGAIGDLGLELVLRQNAVDG